MTATPPAAEAAPAAVATATATPPPAPRGPRPALVPAGEVARRERVRLLGPSLGLAGLVHGRLRVGAAKADRRLEQALGLGEPRPGPTAHAAPAGGGRGGAPGHA